MARLARAGPILAAVLAAMFLLAVSNGSGTRAAYAASSCNQVVYCAPIGTALPNQAGTLGVNPAAAGVSAPEAAISVPTTGKSLGGLFTVAKIGSAGFQHGQFGATLNFCPPQVCDSVESTGAAAAVPPNTSVTSSTLVPASHSSVVTGADLGAKPAMAHHAINTEAGFVFAVKVTALASVLALLAGIVLAMIYRDERVWRFVTRWSHILTPLRM